MKSRIAKYLLPVAFAGAGVFTVASPASAAVPTCNDDVTITKGSIYATYPAYNNNGGCQMSQGASGIEVRVLQKALNVCYGSGLTVDGIFGSLTAANLRRAQTLAEVPADGRYGPTTAGAIKFPYYYDSTGRFAGCQSRY